MSTSAVLRHRRDTAANWTSNNPVLYAGQVGYETDTRKSKIGDGTTAWNSLSYTVAVPTTHTHTSADITDWAEAVDDRVATLLVAGTNITLTYNDGANTLTVDSTGGAGVTDGDKGDITVSSSGSVWSIDTGAVTLAKQADVATGTVFYRKTAGTGAPEVQTLATLKTDLGLTGTNSGDQTITLTGDVTGSGTGSFATTLATVNSNVGTFGSATQVAQVTLNGKGLATAASAVSIAIPSTQVTDFNEAAQDAVGAMVDSTLVYTDSTPLLQRAALTGDVTASAGSNATTIANGAVTLAKQADVATSTVFYRKTAGTGAPEVQTLATLKTDLGLTGTNSGDQTITLTGDVTGSGTGSFAATIGNGAVTYAKMQNVSATDKLLGRSTAGSGVVEEITCTAAGRALLDDADATSQRTTLGLGSLATQSGTFSGTSSGTNTGDQNLFSTIAVSGQSNVVADSTSDTLTLVAGSNVTITTDAATDTITIAASGGGGVSDGDKGDITVSGSGATWTVDNDAITYAKIQNVSATDRILGRSTAGAGDIEEITCTAAGRALLDDADASAQRTTLGLNTIVSDSYGLTVTGVVSESIHATNVTEGASVTINDGVSAFIHTGTTTRSAATITLPANPKNGQQLAIMFAGEITALTLNPNSGQFFAAAAPTHVPSNGSFTYKYRSSDTTWYRESQYCYSTVLDEGSAVLRRHSINFTGSGVSAADNSVNNRTDVTIPGYYSTVEDEGVAVTQRTNINFTGAGVSVADSGGKTVVTISGGGTGSVSFVSMAKWGTD